MELRTIILRFGWDDPNDVNSARLGNLDIEVANWAQDITFSTPAARQAITPSKIAFEKMLNLFVPIEHHGEVVAAILQVANAEMKHRLFL